MMDKDCCNCGEKTERIVVLLLLYALTIESNKNGHCPVGVTAAIRNPAQRDPVVEVLPTNNNSSRRRNTTINNRTILTKQAASFSCWGDSSNQKPSTTGANSSSQSEHNNQKYLPTAVCLL
jgi:hypothetical protein